MVKLLPWGGFPRERLQGASAQGAPESPVNVGQPRPPGLCPSLPRGPGQPRAPGGDEEQPREPVEKPFVPPDTGALAEAGPATGREKLAVGWE